LKMGGLPIAAEQGKEIGEDRDEIEFVGEKC